MRALKMSWTCVDRDYCVGQTAVRHSLEGLPAQVTRAVAGARVLLGGTAQVPIVL